jgi:hypothetical protein
VSYTLVDRIKRYFISREFNYGKIYSAFDLPGSFVSRNNLLFVHIWIICERLRVLGYELTLSIKDYSITQRWLNQKVRKECKEVKQKLKLIAYLNEKLLNLCESQTDKALYLLKVHPAQRNKIKSICEKQAQNVTYLLFKHFELENKGYQDLDVLMQSIFFPQKQPLKEFPEFIFSISEYVMKHREYLSHLSLDDIKNANIDWDVLRIDKKVVKLMKQARNKEEVQSYPQNTLDENDMMVIEMLESILPEEKRKVVEEKTRSNPLKEKYKPIDKF